MAVSIRTAKRRVTEVITNKDQGFELVLAVNGNFTLLFSGPPGKSQHTVSWARHCHRLPPSS
jgi:hypothetical protein